MTGQITKAWLLGAISLFLFGCATGSTYSSLQSKIPTVASGKGRIFFYRTSQPGVQKLLTLDILVDHQRVGSADEGVFFVDLPPGPHSVLCNKCQDPAKFRLGLSPLGQTININLIAGETRYVSFDTLQTGTAVIGLYLQHMSLVDPAQGSQEILNLPYIGH